MNSDYVRHKQQKLSKSCIYLPKIVVKATTALQYKQSRPFVDNGVKWAGCRFIRGGGALL